MKHLTRLSKEMPAQADHDGGLFAKQPGLYSFNEWGDLPIIVALWIQGITNIPLLPSGTTTAGGKGTPEL